MQKAFFAAAVITSVAFTANAALLVDSWTNEGEVWRLSNQPLYESQHIILSEDSDAQLHASVGPGIIIDHLTGHSFYAGLSSVSFELSPQLAVEPVQMVLLSIQLSFGFTDTPTLKFAGQSEGLAGTLVSQESSNTYLGDVPSDIEDQPLEHYVYIWNLNEPVSGQFEIDFSIHAFASIRSVIVTQTLVPEPSTYALLLAGAVTFGAVGVRRMRAARRK